MQQQNKDGSYSEVGWTVTGRLKRTGDAETEHLHHERLQVRKELVSRLYELPAIERRIMQALIGSDIHAGEQ